MRSFWIMAEWIVMTVVVGYGGGGVTAVVVGVK